MESLKQIRALSETLRKALADEPALFAYLADNCLKLGKRKMAAGLLARGLEQFPDHVTGWLIQGKLYLVLNQPDQARTAFKRALELDPDIPCLHEQCSELAQEEADIDGNLHYLSELARLDPLDGNIQTMFQNAAIRRVAVNNGLYSPREVQQILPGVLRKKLIENNLMPTEFQRFKDRAPEEIEPVEAPEPEITPEERPPEIVPGEELAQEPAETDVTPEPEITPEELPPEIIAREEADQEIPETAEPEGRPEDLSGRILQQLKDITERTSPPVQPQAEVEREAPPTPTAEAAPTEPTEPEPAEPAETEPPAKTTEEEQRPEPEIKVSWAAAATDDREETLIEVEPQPEPVVEETAAPPVEPPSGETEPLPEELTDLGAFEPQATEVVTEPSGKEKTEAETTTQEPRESPIMRLLRGNMSEQPTSKELEFVKEEEAAEEAPPEEVPQVEEEPSASGEQIAEPPEAGLEPTPETQAEAPQPQETAEQRLAEIAREVTAAGKPPLEPPAHAEPQQKEHIATKTLAELYASQEQWAQAIGVYEEMLSKHPTNEAYQRRLKELQAKLENSK